MALTNLEPVRPWVLQAFVGLEVGGDYQLMLIYLSFIDFWAF